MNTQTVQKFETWAILELFGHQQMAGHVTEQTFGPATFFRVEVPQTTESPSFDRLLNPSAIYALNPVTEEVAKARAEQIKFKPITAWDIRQILKPVDETSQRRIESAGHNDDDDLEY
ncbi:hypothetical protein GCM10028808_73410 [Spirosoma migulaei]